MLKHYIKMALRLIKRSLLFSSISLLGFVLSQTAAFMIYLWVVDELTYDDCFRGGDRIYRVTNIHREASGEIQESPTVPRTLTTAFRQEFPQVEDATAIKYDDKRSFETDDGKQVTAAQAYVDSTFFRFFTFPVVDGDPQQINDNPGNIVLTDELAQKFFGNTPAIGKKLTFSLGAFVRRTYTVVAVIQIPRKSHIRFDVAMPMDAYMNGNVTIGRSWDTFTEGMYVYVKMKKNAPLRPDEAHEMSRLLAKQGQPDVRLGFQPLHDIHLHTRFSDPHVKNHGNRTTIYLFIALALLIIFMGAFNFTTLSTAHASLRYKEVGVRKVTGAKRRVLIGQFLSEGMVQAGIALILALALTELTLPLFNRMMETDLQLKFSWSVVLYLLFGIIGVGCLAGSYPAFYLSSINPLLAFKGGRKTGRKGGLIRGLVCIQFVIALVLMLFTSIVFKQLHYMQNKDMGLDKENIICIFTNLWYEVDHFKQELLRNPDIKAVSMSVAIGSTLEGTAYEDGNMVRWTDPDGRTDSVRMMGLMADKDFVKTFGLEMIKGKLEFSDYWKSLNKEMNVIINETAWKAMKVADPIGMVIRPGGRIVGVVKDFNFQSMRKKLMPAYIWYNPENLQYLYIKIALERQQQTLAFIRKKFEEFTTTENIFIKEFSYQFFSDQLEQNYTRERQQSGMLLFFTILAIIIAVMGVFGLVALSAEQRTKEIGIRKVHGAHADRIVRQFCREYLIWVGISFLIACPIGYVLMRTWLCSFAYQTDISWWLFLSAGLLMGLVTLLTVIGLTRHKASQNPVESLRYE